jgi:multidrug efflux pump
VVVGGLLFAGVLTLYVIPAVYSYFSRPYTKKSESNIALPSLQVATIPA